MHAVYVNIALGMIKDAPLLYSKWIVIKERREKWMSEHIQCYRTEKEGGVKRRG